MKNVEEFVKQFFPRDFSDRERAVFEAGIALGAITHAVCGFPTTRSTKPFIEKAVEKSFMLQPYRKNIRFRVRSTAKRGGLYKYDTITPNDLEAVVEIEYGQTVVTAKMAYVRRLNYPLMYVSKIIQRRGVSSPHPCTQTRGVRSRCKASNAQG